MTARGGKTLPNMGRDWRRRFRFVIAVREPDRWNRPEVKSALEDLVGFLADDDFRFQFLQSEEPPIYPGHLPLREVDAAPSRYDQVLLFSGGPDSLAGAVEELSRTRDRIVLVSHRSSDWVFSRQRDLAEILSGRFPGRVVHVHDDERAARRRIHAANAHLPLLRHRMRCGRDDGLRADPLFRERAHEFQSADRSSDRRQPRNPVNAPARFASNDGLRQSHTGSPLRGRQPICMAYKGRGCAPARTTRSNRPDRTQHQLHTRLENGTTGPLRRVRAMPAPETGDFGSGPGRERPAQRI